MSVTTPGAYGNVTAVPVSVADQPAKVNPALVGAVGSATVPPLEKTLLETVDPPFELKVTALSKASQRANKVMFDVTPGA
jgi:hypothetical protein